jgi:hypothetical protein
MSVTAQWITAHSALQRARALFPATPLGAFPVDGATDLTTAAHGVAAARTQSGPLSGTAGTAYRSVAERAVSPLHTAAASDAALAGQLRTAAAMAQAGATEMDTIVSASLTLGQRAPMVKTPADQRIFLTALRGHLTAGRQTVTATAQGAATVAQSIRGLPYPRDTTRPPGTGSR